MSDATTFVISSKLDGESTMLIGQCQNSFLSLPEQQSVHHISTVEYQCSVNGADKNNIKGHSSIEKRRDVTNEIFSSSEVGKLTFISCFMLMIGI